MAISNLRGISTISIFAEDHPAAVKWYTEFIDKKPYYTQPGYAEFRVGDSEIELGIIDSSYAPGTQSAPGARAGVVAYWAVDDIETVLNKCLQMGAVEHEPKTNRGNGFITASVIDPFGNILGIMLNPHYRKL